MRMTRASKRRIKDKLRRGAWVPLCHIVNYNLTRWMDRNLPNSTTDFYFQIVRAWK
jgi:hypothetical protein